MKDAIEVATESMREAEESLLYDPYHPQFHFRPPVNWMNDPNGTIYYKGEYHVFYQLNPFGDTWGRIHWGHAKSKDLIHWKHLPIALAPSKDQGENHCFSGCCVINEGVPTIFYTKIGNLKDVVSGAEQWAAISKDDMITWEKPEWNPALSEDLHPKGKIYEWRDPYVWQENDVWYMVVVGKIKIWHPYGRIFLYKSHDLKNWTFIKTLIRGTRKISQARGWECPNFLELGQRHILLVSPYGPVIYNVGMWENEEFTPGLWYKIDHSHMYYATNTIIDDQSRKILVGWVKAEGRGGWKGCLGLPRLLSLDDQNQMNMEFVPEARSLRDTKKTFDLETFTEYRTVTPHPIPDNMCEIKLSCTWPSNLRFMKSHPPEIGVKFSDNYRTYTMCYNPKKHTIKIGLKTYKLQYPLGNPEISLHLYFDKSVLEIIINSREAITDKFYPTRITDEKVASLEVAPHISGMEAHDLHMEVWTINPIWNKEEIEEKKEI